MGPDHNTRHLLDRVVRNDQTASHELFSQYAPKLTRAIALKMHPRLSRRVEPADIVQEAFAEAHRRLPEFLQKDNYTFYGWVRNIAMSRLKDAHRRHIVAKKRSVLREDHGVSENADESVLQLVDRIALSGITPSSACGKKEVVEGLKYALNELDEEGSEVLILRFVEDLSPSEIARVINVSERTVRRRQRDAIATLGRFLRQSGWETMK